MAGKTHTLILNQSHSLRKMTVPRWPRFLSHHPLRIQHFLVQPFYPTKEFVMKHSKLILILTAIAIAGVPVTAALAKDGGPQDRPSYGTKHKGSGSYGRHHGKRHGKDGGMEGMVSHKAHFFLMHQEELGLSEDQVKQIKGLALATKKTVIAKQAEIDIVKTDLHAAMWEESPDAAAVRSLVAKKYDLKKEKALAVTDALLQLKTVLTPEQKAKAKTVWKTMRNDHKSRRMSPDMPDPMDNE
ncbi:MAG: Spy/CpxP family protein refolding chaperone [Candidatus Omnitrophica bacterium]|nr:Spy/CpxP family protein refolding chaperone [Candidatus Omnitrophota bacterium]